ncbi:uncharacterized protein LOC144907423 isoform X4 [Branchiostoma floridae x Branchiostoma belcheri]
MVTVATTSTPCRSGSTSQTTSSPGGSCYHGNCCYDIHSLPLRFYFSDNIIPRWVLLSVTMATVAMTSTPCRSGSTSQTTSSPGGSCYHGNCCYDIHSLPLRFYFSDNIIPRLESAIPLIQRELLRLPDQTKIAVAFPDEGAWKRFHLQFEDRFPLITCTKVREEDTRQVTVKEGKRRVTIKEGDPKGRHVVIVDDLVMTGGTLKECAKVLLSHGAEKISAYVTHPVFPHDSWKLFTQSDVAFQNFWITDSVPHARQIAEHPPFKLLPLADVISEGLLGLSFVSH